MADSAPDHVLRVPRVEAWINANDRTHWRTKADQTRTWREAAGFYAKHCKLSALGPSRVVAELHMLSRRRARIDPANYSPTAKAVVDGLVDAGVWPDDSSGWVTGPDMRLGPVVKAGGVEALVLHIWGRPCCDGHEEVA